MLILISSFIILLPSKNDKFCKSSFILRADSTFDDDLGIGYCMGCKIFHPHMGYIRFEIQAIFIDPNYHSQGLGEKLMRYAIHDQAQKGVKWFSLQALITNEKASAFYESLGFEKRPNNFNRYYLWQDKLDKFLG